MKKLPVDFKFLGDMYRDDYYPPRLVDKVRGAIKELVAFLESSPHSPDEVQAELDRVTRVINDLQGEFEENESEIETVARDSIGTTVEEILKFFAVDIDIETAIRERDW